jgi:hypothetical protein
MVRGEIERYRGAKGMADDGKARLQLFFGSAEATGQRIQSGVTRRPHTSDRGVAGALTVAGIIDQQEGVVGVWITRQDRCPIA